MPRGAILISAVVIVTTITFLYLEWTIEQPPAAQVVGVALMIFGGWMFRATIAASRNGGLRFAFDEEGPRSLVTAGPYRVVRHPFYVSYIVFWAGWSIAAWSWVALLPFAILVVIYVVAARMEERLFAGTPMAAQYEDYRRQTGFFWPRLPG
jgi:protein-S-isoprenylcysteine O-methyltransferase Ste14